MSDELFCALEQSLKEAKAIESGKLPPARTTTIVIPDCKSIRNKLGITQQELATTIGTSLDAVKKWEQKRRNPSGLAAKVLLAIDKNNDIYSLIKNA